MKTIKSIEELKKLAKDGIEVSILLNFGGKSSKWISYNEENKTFSIENYIDGSKQELKEKNLKTKSNIVEAIEKNSLLY